MQACRDPVSSMVFGTTGHHGHHWSPLVIQPMPTPSIPRPFGFPPPHIRILCAFSLPLACRQCQNSSRYVRVESQAGNGPATPISSHMEFARARPRSRRDAQVRASLRHAAQPARRWRPFRAPKTRPSRPTFGRRSLENDLARRGFTLASC